MVTQLPSIHSVVSLVYALYVNVRKIAFLLQAIRVEHCERVHLITAARRICIANCRECVFFLGVNQQPLIVGDNHKLQVSLGVLFTLK